MLKESGQASQTGLTVLRRIGKKLECALKEAGGEELEPISTKGRSCSAFVKHVTEQLGQEWKFYD